MVKENKALNSQAFYHGLTSVLTKATGGAIGGWLWYRCSLSVTVARRTYTWLEERWSLDRQNLVARISNKRNWIAKLNKYPKYLPMLLVYSRSKYQMYQVMMWNKNMDSENMIRNKVEISTRKHSSIGALMCSSKNCSSFALLFFLYFWAVVVFLGNFDFFFLFF